MNLFSWGRGDDDGPAPVAAGSATAAGAEAGAGADANADAGQRARPAPLDLGDQPDDAAKWARSRARWNLAIKPDSPEFVQQKAVFEAALDPGSGKSIEDTLREHFSNYEAHKFSGWADRRREPDLHTQQKRDTEAYNTLLTRSPWVQEAPQAFLAFKMTMLYFGFSVEPMKMNDFFRLPRGSGLFGLDDDDDDDDGELDDQRTFIPEEMRPLRFLNRYDKRCYGADNGHMMPDPTYEMYYGLPFQPPEGQQHGQGGAATAAQPDIRIRGRGLGEDKDEDMEDDSMSDGSVDGASFCSDSLVPDAPDVDVDGDSGDGRVLNLRGGSGGSGPEGNAVVCSFSGYTACNIHWARGFYAAVDTALVLGKREGVQITVALIRILPQQWATILELERGSLGSVKDETDLHNRLLAAYTRARRGSTNGALAFFVCHKSNEEALVELQKKGQGAGTLGTPINNPEVFHFAKQDRSGTSAAYLWMPRAVTKDTASNIYTKWFKNVVRIASGPQQGDGKLGRRTAQLPRGSYLVQVGDIGPSFHHESPLPREVWEKIVERGRQSSNEVKFNLSFISLERQAFAQVPGYFPPTRTTATALSTDAVFKLAWDSVPAHDRSSVARIVIRRPGDAGSATFACKNGSVDHTTTSYSNAEGRLRDWLRHKYFFHVVPQWDEYEVTVPHADQGGAPNTFTFPGNLSWSQIRSRLLSGLDFSGWKISEDTAASQYVLRIDQRTAAGPAAGDTLQRNRLAWDMDLGIGQKCNELWRDFRAALSVKRLYIVPVRKFDDNGNPTITDPLASDLQDPVWSRWGCNRPSVNLDTGEPVVESSPTKTQTETPAQDHGHHHHHDGNTHSGQPAQSQSQGQGQHHDQDQGILHQGVPQLGAGVDIFQSGKYYREQSFATPLSVQVGDQKPRFPINAPPLEHIRRPRGPDGIESDSMPIVSTQIMTPTEQRTLQQAFFQMRSIALNRAQQCPHKGCDLFFPVGPGNTAAFHAHLDAKHVGTHCPFCDDTLFKHWSATDKQRHFVDKHSEYFTAKGDLLREALLADKTESKGNVHPREEQYSFCPRCGRDHRQLNSKADRVHHDNACFPGNEATLAAEPYCRRCGQPDERQHHQCAAAAAAATVSDIFCNNCALECHLLPVSYGRRHLLKCKPLASDPDSWCPWCGVDLKSGPRSVRLQHLAACVLKPASGQNPVCTDTGLPLESPRDHTAHLLKHGLKNLGASNRTARITVPPRCPVDGCHTDLSSWNAQGLYYHFVSHPENVLEKGGGLKSCPFCECNFELRGFRTSVEKQQHFDDHIKHRHQRVLADEIIGSNPDRESDVVLDAFATLKYDEFDQKAQIDLLNEESQQLSETVKRLSAENREFRDDHHKKEKCEHIEGKETRRAARASRFSPFGGTDAPVSKRKDGAGRDLAGPPAKKSRVVHYGPSTTTVPGFGTARQLLRSVPDADEDWSEEEEEEDDELTLESEVDVEEGIIDDEDDDDDDYDDDGLEDDDYDELAD